MGATVPRSVLLVVGLLVLAIGIAVAVAGTGAADHTDRLSPDPAVEFTVMADGIEVANGAGADRVDLEQESVSAVEFHRVNNDIMVQVDTLEGPPENRTERAKRIVARDRAVRERTDGLSGYHLRVADSGATTESALENRTPAHGDRVVTADGTEDATRMETVEEVNITVEEVNVSVERADVAEGEKIHVNFTEMDPEPEAIVTIDVVDDASGEPAYRARVSLAEESVTSFESVAPN